MTGSRYVAAQNLTDLEAVEILWPKVSVHTDNNTPLNINLVVKSDSRSVVKTTLRNCLTQYAKFNSNGLKIAVNLFFLSRTDLKSYSALGKNIKVYDLSCSSSTEQAEHITFLLSAPISAVVFAYHADIPLLEKLWYAKIKTVVIADHRDLSARKPLFQSRHDNIPLLVILARQLPLKYFAGIRIPRQAISWRVIRNCAFESSKAKDSTASANKRLLAYLLLWIGNYAIREVDATKQVKVLFLTNNLGQGGAQRSLANLLSSFPRGHAPNLCLIYKKVRSSYLGQLLEADVPVSHLENTKSLNRKISRLLSFIKTHEFNTVCFWNVDVRIKSVLCKIYKNNKIKFIDVCPGPKTEEQIREHTKWFSRIAFSPFDYFDRLDTFVTKYKGGGIPNEFGAFSAKTIVIRNGVFIPSKRSFCLNTTPSVRPLEAAAAYAVVTCCRIVPAKLLEDTLYAAAAMHRKLPTATLTIVGDLNVRRHEKYYQSIMQLYHELKLEGVVYFVGEHMNPTDFLREFKVFLMLSRFQGCPNASLEAMACGLPVVANPNGGTGEQIINNKTGLLVSENQHEEIADRLIELLNDPVRAKAIGDRALMWAAKQFSMQAMVLNYKKLLCLE